RRSYLEASVAGGVGWRRPILLNCLLGCAAALSVLVAGCGNQYRPVVSAINPVGPAGQPAKYAVAISSPSASSPGLLTFVDFSGDTVLTTPQILSNPNYLALAPGGSHGDVIGGDERVCVRAGAGAVAGGGADGHGVAGAEHRCAEQPDLCGGREFGGARVCDQRGRQGNSEHSVLGRERKPCGVQHDSGGDRSGVRRDDRGWEAGVHPEQGLGYRERDQCGEQRQGSGDAGDSGDGNAGAGASVGGSVTTHQPADCAEP